MKKTVLLMSLALALVLLAGTGCQLGPKGPSDEELIRTQLQTMKDAVFAGDKEKILSVFSEEFTHYEVPDKATLADYLQMGIDMGYLDQIKDQNAVINLEDAKVTIDKDTATVYPIAASADMGSVTIEVTMKKEADGVWRITTADVEGI